MSRADFSEVGHTGGKATFTIRSGKGGQVSYQIGYSHFAPRPSTLVGVYAHHDGFACGNIEMGGIGQQWSPPPLPNCVAVIMASDSQGKFGHECPECKKHFRTDNIPAKYPLTCSYCGLRAESYHFLTSAQKAYIAHYVDSLNSALIEIPADATSEVIIDMDAIADSVTDDPRPDFYYTSTAQQTEFECQACNSYNDIRGRYGYCASCGWRNTAFSLKTALERIREQLNNNAISASEAVKQSVSEFDSAARDFVDQLVARVPMKESRRSQLEVLLFHNLEKFDGLMKSCFDIDLLRGMSGDRKFVLMMFFRRHVYEHDGGVMTKRYVENSGDTLAEEGTLLRETSQNAHKLIGCLNRMIATLEHDFHEMFEPESFCIDIEKERKQRTETVNA